MATKKAKRKHRPWNKGRVVGRKTPLGRSEATAIKQLLRKRGAAGVMDLALFSTAIDTMLRAPDLLGLTVKDVRKRNRLMRETFAVTTARYGQSVRCEPSKITLRALEKWIKQSAKKPSDYLFTGRQGGGLVPLSARQFSRLVKDWTMSIGLDANCYGNASLRRTGAINLMKKTGNIDAVRIMLEHADIETTQEYLSDAI